MSPHVETLRQMATWYRSNTVPIAAEKAAACEAGATALEQLDIVHEEIKALDAIGITATQGAQAWELLIAILQDKSAYHWHAAICALMGERSASRQKD